MSYTATPMTPQAAATVLGLTGSEDADRIQAAYETQAAALDARIQRSEGEDRARYVRDREEVELARLALLGSAVRPTSPGPATAEPAPKPVKAASGFAGDMLFAGVAILLFAVPSAIAGYLHPTPHHPAGEMAATMAIVGPLWLLIGVALTTVIHYPLKRLFGWSPAPYVMGAYMLTSWGLCRRGEPTQTTTDFFVQLSADAWGCTLVVGVVIAIIVAAVFYPDRKPAAK